MKQLQGNQINRALQFRHHRFRRNEAKMYRTNTTVTTVALSRLQLFEELKIQTNLIRNNFPAVHCAEQEILPKNRKGYFGTQTEIVIYVIMLTSLRKTECYRELKEGKCFEP